MPQILLDLAQVIGGFSALFVVIALGLAYRQFKTSVQSQKLQALSAVFEQIEASAGGEGRRRVYLLPPERLQELAGKQPQEETEEDRKDAESIERVIRSYNRLGFMLHLRLVHEKELLIVADSVTYYWDRLSPYVQARYRTRNAPQYASYFENLARVLANTMTPSL